MKRLSGWPFEPFILLIPLVLVAIGCVSIYTISFHATGTKLLFNQLGFLGVAAIIFILVALSDYRLWAERAIWLYLAAAILLIPLLPNLAPRLPFVQTVFGASRWLDFGLIRFQPAEIFKLVGAIAGASFLSHRVLSRPVTFIYLLGLFIPVGLIMAQPDLGTAILVSSIGLLIFLVARPPIKSLLTVGMLIVVAAPIIFLTLRPYQRQRLETFFNHDTVSSDQNYNIQQSLIAVGSGGLTGQGFGQGSQTALNFLPVAHTDFIFAGFAEATGFLGSVILIGLYLVLLGRLIGVAREFTDPFTRYFTLAFAGKIFFQMVVNIGMNVGLMPVTGIPLPFMSYGGTALIIDFFWLGLVQSCYARQNRPLFTR